jgi:hypothetical protein
MFIVPLFVECASIGKIADASIIIKFLAQAVPALTGISNWRLEIRDLWKIIFTSTKIDKNINR